jgi:hypothetical protein
VKELLNRHIYKGETMQLWREGTHWGWDGEINGELFGSFVTVTSDPSTDELIAAVKKLLIDQYHRTVDAQLLAKEAA